MRTGKRGGICIVLIILMSVFALGYNSLDVNSDGCVDTKDLATVSQCYGALTGCSESNVDGENGIDQADYDIVYQLYQEGLKNPTADCSGYTCSVEVCDGLDNDCDGEVDEDFDNDNDGYTTCGFHKITGSFIGADCNDNNAAVNPSAADSFCNGVDDDCDGSADDAYIVISTNCGIGGCAASGQTSCVQGNVLDSCVPGIPSSDANCDGIDNDCDGNIDEDYPVKTTSCGIGGCAAAGQMLCQDGIERDSCSPKAASVEVCDGIDNNCNGVLDEGFPDTDKDKALDCLDEDDDNDGVLDVNDNCVLVANFEQADYDSDGEGDACDEDIDGDNVLNDNDQCPYSSFGALVDSTGCSYLKEVWDMFDITPPARKKMNNMRCNSDSECEAGYCVENRCSSLASVCGDGVCSEGELCEIDNCCGGETVIDGNVCCEGILKDSCEEEVFNIDLSKGVVVDSVNLFTGKVDLNADIFTLEGMADLDLGISARYHTDFVSNFGVLGKGWDMNFGYIVLRDGKYTMVMPDGADVLVPIGGGKFLKAKNDGWKIRTDVIHKWVAESPDGTVYNFGNVIRNRRGNAYMWMVNTIKDPYANNVKIEYNGIRPFRIINSIGRRAVFNYDSNLKSITIRNPGFAIDRIYGFEYTDNLLSSIKQYSASMSDSLLINSFSYEDGKLSEVVNYRGGKVSFSYQNDVVSSRKVDDNVDEYITRYSFDNPKQYDGYTGFEKAGIKYPENSGVDEYVFETSYPKDGLIKRKISKSNSGEIVRSEINEWSSKPYQAVKGHLVSHYGFEEDSGFVAEDSAGDNELRLAGAVRSPGIAGNALEFNGAYTYGRADNSASLQLNKDLTLSFWIKPENIGSGRLHPIDKLYWREFSLVIEPNGALSYYHGVYNKRGYYIGRTLLGAGVLKNRQWYHIAVTRDAKTRTIKIYLNGRFIRSTQYSWQWWRLPYKSNNPLNIGYGFTGSYLKGMMDEIKIYNKVLAPAQIKAQYNSNEDNFDFEGVSSNLLLDKKLIKKGDNALSVDYTYNGQGWITKEEEKSGNYYKIISNRYSKGKLFDTTTTGNGISLYEKYFWDKNKIVQKNLLSSGQWRVEKYRYDVKGNLVRFVDADGKVVNYFYGGYGNFVVGKNQGKKYTTKSYYPNGLLKSDANLGATSNYDYDKFGRLSSVKLPSFKTDFIYLPNQMSSTLSSEKGSVMSLEQYDGFGKIIHTEVDSGRGYAIAQDFDYDAFGEISSISENYRLHVVGQDTYVPEHHTIYTYKNDPLRRLSKFESIDGSFTSYDYLGDSVIVNENNEQYSREVVNVYGDLLQYQELKEGKLATSLYDYDIFGNLISLKEGRSFLDLSYDGFNQLTKVSSEKGSTDFDYDKSGKMIKMKSPKGEVNQFSYNKFNQLSNIKQDGKVVEEYEYDENFDISKFEAKGDKTGDFLYGIDYGSDFARIVDEDGDNILRGVELDLDKLDEIELPISKEVCDGKDNDLDSYVDHKIWGASLCAKQMGVCLGWTLECDYSTGGFKACDYSAVRNYESVETKCDGIDNDCDGTVDEGCVCESGSKRSCGHKLGVCKQGEQLCLGGEWQGCVGFTMPVQEVCDNLDNDCDGVIDNGVKNKCGQCGNIPTEVCDGFDNDCDGLVDEGVSGGMGCV